MRFAASHSVASRSCASQISTLGQADVGDAIFALERLLQRPPSDAVKNQSNAARRWRAVAETAQHAIDATRARSLRRVRERPPPSSGSTDATHPRRSLQQRYIRWRDDY